MSDPPDGAPVESLVDEVPAFVRRLRERKATHRDRGRLYRLAFVLAGFIVLAAGLAMLVLPGPAFVMIPIGLALLALEFAWAEELLERALRSASAAQQRAAEASAWERRLTIAAAISAIGAAIAAAIVWDIPLLPV